MIARASCRLPEVESYANDPVTLPIFVQVAWPPVRDREVTETVCGRVRASSVDRVNGLKDRDGMPGTTMADVVAPMNWREALPLDAADNVAWISTFTDPILDNVRGIEKLPW